MNEQQSATLPPVRLPRALLDAAKAEARRRDETLSQVIRRALRAYVGSATEPEDAIAATHRPQPSHQPPSPAAAALRLRLDELDAAGVPDSEYRAVFSTGAKDRLRRGETWRSRLVVWIASEDASSARP